MTFASRSIARHLVRGVVGIAALIGLVTLAPQHPAVAVVLLPLALVALRGCPMCWTIGLAQTIWARARRRPVDACTDGSCAVAEP